MYLFIQKLWVRRTWKILILIYFFLFLTIEVTKKNYFRIGIRLVYDRTIILCFFLIFDSILNWLLFFKQYKKSKLVVTWVGARMPWAGAGQARRPPRALTYQPPSHYRLLPDKTNDCIIVLASFFCSSLTLRELSLITG